MAEFTSFQRGILNTVAYKINCLNSAADVVYLGREERYHMQSAATGYGSVVCRDDGADRDEDGSRLRVFGLRVVWVQLKSHIHVASLGLDNGAGSAKV